MVRVCLEATAIVVYHLATKPQLGRRKTDQHQHPVFSGRWCDFILNYFIVKTLKRRFRSSIRQTAVPRPDGIRVKYHSRSRTKTLAGSW